MPGALMVPGWRMAKNDREYFRRRAAQEQAAAAAATNDTAAAIHRQLARRYLDLVGQTRVVEAPAIAPQASL